MKRIVFVSIDKPSRWSGWHSGSTASVYYSDFLDTEEEAKDFIQKVKNEYPESNLAHDSDSAGFEWYIKYVVIMFDHTDENGFKTLCRMMGAYHSYKEEHTK